MRDEENPHGARHPIYDLPCEEIVLLLAPYYTAEPMMQASQVLRHTELEKQLIQRTAECTEGARAN